MKPTIPVFHAPEPTETGQPRPRLIDVGGPGSPDFDSHQTAAMNEDAAEEGRLLYVALTRAKHHLVLWWIENTANSADTKLHELLTRGDPSGEDIGWLIEAADGTIEQTILTEPNPRIPFEAGERTASDLGRAHLDRSLDHAWRRVSFSSLSPEHPLAGDADTTEQPDRIDEPVTEGEAPFATSGQLAMAELPRGARFGSLVHEILERIPFDNPELSDAIRGELARATRHASWGFDVDKFVTGMVTAMETPLGPRDDALTLRNLDPARTLKEMDFELPVRTKAGTTSLPDIAAVMLDYLPDEDPHRAYASRLHRLEQRRFRGYLTGAIDITATMPGLQGDRYLVMDFKSNALPTLGDAPAPTDYGPRPLTVAMHEGHYVLQGLLYQVALHRYLQWRLVDYNPVTHLGGSMYLFMRGMTGADAPVVDGERCGVARWSPPPEMIVAVSNLFAGSAP